MDRVLAAFVAAAVCSVGCSSSAPRQLVGGGAVLSGVSSDQQWVAVLTGATRLPTGGHLGTLEVLPAAGGAPTVLDDHSPGGVFNRGTALWYLGGASVVNEPSSPATPPVVAHVYGGLFVWTPAMGAPAQIGSIVRDFTVAQAGTSCVFLDLAVPSNDAATTGTLVAVSASSCAAGACNRMKLAEGVVDAQAAWRLSSDGNSAIVTVRGATAADPGRVLLVSFGSGQAQLLSTGVNPRSPMMTRDGATVAWVEGQNEIHVQPVGGSATVILPSSPVLDAAAMIDPATYVGKTRALASGPPALAVVSAAGTTPLPVQKPQEFFVSQYVPGVTDRFVFFQLATIAANGAPDLWMLDLFTPGAQPVQLAGAVENPIGADVTFSDDGTTAELSDNFDPVTRRGDEFVVPLKKPTRSLVAVGVHSAAFIPGSSHLLYIAAPDPDTGAGVLTVLRTPTALGEVQGVGTVNFADPRGGPARTWFTQTTGAPDDGVWYMPQP